MTGPPVGSAMPARNSMQTTYRLKGGAQARQTRQGNEPRPQSNISITNLVQKLLTQTIFTYEKRQIWTLELQVLWAKKTERQLAESKDVWCAWYEVYEEYHLR